MSSSYNIYTQSSTLVVPDGRVIQDGRYFLVRADEDTQARASVASTGKNGEYELVYTNVDIIGGYVHAAMDAYPDEMDILARELAAMATGGELVVIAAPSRPTDEPIYRWIIAPGEVTRCRVTVEWGDEIAALGDTVTWML